MKKIVDLSFISYFPADNGGKQAIFYRLSAMARMNKVYAISINSEFDVIDITFKDNYMKNMEYIIIPSVEKRRDSCSNLELFLQLYRWLMSGKPRKSAKIYSEKIVDTITKKIQKISPDIIYLESIFVFDLVDWSRISRKNIKIVQVVHNNEIAFFNATMKRWPTFLADIERQRISNYEENIAKFVDYNLCISPNDLSYYENFAPNVKFVPPHMPLPSKKWKPNKNKYIFFAAPLSFMPNYEGLIWFLENVFCEFIKSNEQYILKLTGKISEEIKKKFVKFKNIEFTGYLSNEELEELMICSSFTVIPIFSGSGVNIKLLQAMSYGVPIITTPHSASGVIAYDRSKQPFLVTDDAKCFVYYMNLLTDESKQKSFSHEARELFSNNYACEKNLNTWLLEDETH